MKPTPITPTAPINLNRPRLDALYQHWNRPEFISPDPLETILRYPRTEDREVAALAAASMAYGRVATLLPPLERVLAAAGDKPRDYVLKRTEKEMQQDLAAVTHRFARPTHLAALLAGTGAALRRYGSLQDAFLEGYRNTRNDAIAGLLTLSAAVKTGARNTPGHLLPDPARGSACKRLLLFLRWMVRRDAVDPGGWNSVRPADLLLPLDTWTHRIALRAGWTARRSADQKTVREISAELRKINPDDPVKYDFTLSRFGIRSELNLESLFSSH